MASVSEQEVEVSYEEMSSLELVKHMKDMLKVLEKKAKADESKLKKFEAKEEKRERAAPAKGVRPSQLDENNAWVEFVHQHMLGNGWKSFTHKERHGKGIAEIEFPESEEIVLPGGEDGQTVMVFRGVEPAQQPSLSHAMSVSKAYKELVVYAEWKASWDAEHPEEEKQQVKVEAKAVVRVSMTLAEKMAEKARKEAEKEAEKVRKAAERTQKKAEAEAKKKQEKADKEAAKQLAALNKSVKGGPKAAVLRAMVPMMKPVLKAVAKPVWEAPEDNEVKPWVVKGVTYLRMANDFLFVALPNDALGPPVGLYDPKTDTIDTTQKSVFVDDD